MGAWIEIEHTGESMQSLYGRTPRWVRGLKFGLLNSLSDVSYVALHDGCVD